MTAQEETTSQRCRGRRTFPPVFEEKAGISLETVAVYSIGSIHNIENNVIEKRLERRDGGARCSKQARKGIGRSDAQG